MNKTDKILVGTEPLTPSEQRTICRQLATVKNRIEFMRKQSISLTAYNPIGDKARAHQLCDCLEKRGTRINPDAQAASTNPMLLTG